MRAVALSVTALAGGDAAASIGRSGAQSGGGLLDDTKHHRHWSL